MRGRAFAIALAAPVTLLLAACGSDQAADTDGAGAVAAGETIDDLLDDDGSLSRTAALIERTGLDDVLDAAPSYTLLAPTDTAMGEVDPGADGNSEDLPAMAALLRGHLLPGFVSLEDIEKAIEASDDGRVTMQTMAQTPVTFTREGEAITVTAADGATATIVGPGLNGGNGVILPVNGLLKTL